MQKILLPLAYSSPSITLSMRLQYNTMYGYIKFYFKMNTRDIQLLNALMLMPLQ